ncbi:MAG: VanZ family protein [Ignavibacteria bacterium]|nr:VanZ family protein [Ignavibacteria bacterium]
MKINPRIYHISLFTYCLIIFILSSIPGDDFPQVGFQFGDKIVHFIIYAILFSLFFYSLKNQSKYVRLQKFALEFSFLFTVLYGITDELHQYFVPYRSCEFYDWVADAAGGLFMYLMFKYFSEKRKIMAAAVIMSSVIGCSGTDNYPVQKSSPHIRIESEETWLNLMPVVDDELRNVLCFSIKLNFSGKKSDTDYTITDFKIDLNNDKLRNKKFLQQFTSVNDSVLLLNIYQSPDEIYLDKTKEYPEEAVFTFKIMKNDRLIKSVKTQKIKVQKTY